MSNELKYGRTETVRTHLDNGREGIDALRSLLTRKEFHYQCLGLIAWMASIAFLWSWWLQPEHNINTPHYIAVSVILAWVTLLPLYPLAIIPWAKYSVAALPATGQVRVAMIVTKVPSEPFFVVQRTLEAMLAQNYPHDTWLADEAPTPETIAWCKIHGVHISTRNGVDDYHRTTWPRRRKCKEGNLAYFYDVYGYDMYDFVVQLDADHVPTQNYLREMLRPFADPRVGYVSAPSICDANADSSWAARSRLQVEGVLHGPLQAGYNAGWAPLCIGSHYAVRTAALRDIGGLGPELAEDHSTTLMMNANGWRGVHAINAIAHGDGPRTFADLITQEFQWSRSIVSILLTYTPHYWKGLSPRLRFQFAFCQLWYPTFAVLMLLMYALPIYAMLIGEQIVNVNYIDFIWHSLPTSIALILIVAGWRRNGWLRPYDAKVFGWEGLLLQFARWPWVLAGSVAAVKDRVTGTFVDYRITPKGSDAAVKVPWRVLTPYIGLATLSALPVTLLSEVGSANGYFIFAIINTCIYLTLVAVILFAYAIENVRGWQRWIAVLKAQVVVASIALLIAVLPIREKMARGVEALTWQSEWLAFTEERYVVSGAGVPGTRLRKIRFRSLWQSNDTKSRK